MKKIFTTLLLLAVAPVQPLCEMPSHTCRANDMPAGGKSAQENPSDPSREALARDFEEVLIGYFGPDDPYHPEGGDMWCAASLAIEQANKAGGCNGRSFKLISRWSENPWGSGVKNVAEMAYKHNVCAIIGGIDGPSTHLAEQVVAKARLPLLSGANTDRTANLANVPWMFSSLPGHHLQAAALTEAIGSFLDGERLIVISAVDHDSHLLAIELKKCFRKKQIAPSYHFDFKDGQADNSELIGRIVEAKPKALAIIAPLYDTAHLCLNLRNTGFKGTIFGGPCMSRHRFIDIAGAAAEGAMFPLLYESSKKNAAFEKDFLDRFERHSDYLAAHTYDTVNILIEAIRRAGLDRQRIRDEIEKLSPYSGVTGSICWDRQGGNSRPISLGTTSDGCVKMLTSCNDITYLRPDPSKTPR